MDFKDWQPYYLRILTDFSFAMDADEEAARELRRLASGHAICRPACLRKRITRVVSVLGNGPDLERAVVEHYPPGTIITAGPATTRAMEIGIVPDLFVTDLDGPLDGDIEANREGAVAVVHAHGDNIPQLERHLPELTGPLTPTVQCLPRGVYNFGGFTDGDRAVMMARHFGAREIQLFGFDFLHPTAKPGASLDVKRRKMRWARFLIFELNPTGVRLYCHGSNQGRVGVPERYHI